jgi:hypothetical protein
VGEARRSDLAGARRSGTVCRSHEGGGSCHRRNSKLADIPCYRTPSAICHGEYCAVRTDPDLARPVSSVHVRWPSHGMERLPDPARSGHSHPAGAEAPMPAPARPAPHAAAWSVPGQYTLGLMMWVWHKEGAGGGHPGHSALGGSACRGPSVTTSPADCRDGSIAGGERLGPGACSGEHTGGGTPAWAPASSGETESRSARPLSAPGPTACSRFRPAGRACSSSLPDCARALTEKGQKAPRL